MIGTSVRNAGSGGAATPVVFDSTFDASFN
jgi:hypothetical protein